MDAARRLPAPAPAPRGMRSRVEESRASQRKTLPLTAFHDQFGVRSPPLNANPKDQHGSQEQTQPRPSNERTNAT